MARRNLPDGRKALTPDERDRLLAALGKMEPAQAALIRFVYETADRISEALHARWEDIDRASLTVRVVRGKGSSEVRVLISKKLLALLDATFAQRTGLIFRGGGHCQARDRGAKPKRGGILRDCPGGHISHPTAWRHFRRAARLAGIHEALAHPHTARHTRLCDVARSLKDIDPRTMLAELVRISGHKSVDQLMDYFDAPETKQLRYIALRADLEKM